MSKIGQRITKGIACTLAAVVAVGTIVENAGVLFARETFSGLKNMLADKKEFVIVEVVDDFSEASMGYLVEGQEPYSSELNNELLDELRSRGLLTTGDTDDWNSYPLRYDIVETRYSEISGDQTIMDQGFREQGLTTVSGYYEQVDPSEAKALYRIDASIDISVMTPAKLRKVAQQLLDSYAPNHPDVCPDGYYSTDDSNYCYYRFVAGKAPSPDTTPTPTVNPAPTAVSTPEAESTPGAESTPEAESTPGAVSTPGAESTPGAVSTPEAVSTPAGGSTPAPAQGTSPEANPIPAPAQPTGQTSASASSVIYVEIDEKNSVLLASNGDGVSLPEDDSGSEEDADQETQSIEQNSTQNTEQNSTQNTEQNNTQNIEQNNTQNIEQNNTQNIEQNNTQSNGQDNTQSGSRDAADSSSDDLTDDSSEDNSTADDPSADAPAADGASNASSYTVTFKWEWPSEGEPSSGLPDLPSETTISGNTYYSALSLSDPSEITVSEGKYTFDGWYVGGIKIGASTTVDGSAASDGKITIVGKWTYTSTVCTIHFVFKGLTYEELMAKTNDESNFAYVSGNSTNDCNQWNCGALDDIKRGAGEEISLPIYNNSYNVTVQNKRTGEKFRLQGWEYNGTVYTNPYVGEKPKVPDPMPSTSEITFTGTWEKIYTVTYEWRGLENAGQLHSITDESNMTPGSEVTPEVPAEAEVTDTKYTVDSSWHEGSIVGKYQGDDLLGIYRFSGWKLKDAVQSGKITLTTGKTILTGEWEYIPNCTVTYEWMIEPAEGRTLPVAADQITLKEDENDDYWLTCPGEVQTLGKEYTVDASYSADVEYKAYNADGKLIGTCRFEGWRVGGEGEDLSGKALPVNASATQVSLVGKWIYEPVKYAVTYDWGTIPGLQEVNEQYTSLAANTVLNGVTVNDNDSPLTVNIGSAPATLSAEMRLPEEESYAQGDAYLVNGDYEKGQEILITVFTTDPDSKKKMIVPIGKFVFSGWQGTDDTGVERVLGPGEKLTMKGPGPVTLKAEWQFVGYAPADLCRVSYSWSGKDGDDNPDNDDASIPPLGTKSLEKDKPMPNGVILTEGGQLSMEVVLPTEVSTFYRGMTYRISESSSGAADYPAGLTVKVTENGELVGEYVFSGWNSVKVGNGEERALTKEEAEQGFFLTTEGTSATDIVISGEWEYKPAVAAGQIIGNGYAYAYVKDGIRNNHWFKYYVLGLEEGTKQFDEMNVRVITYLSDGSEKREYGSGTSFSSLGDALNAADLVYLNTDGLDAEGNGIPSGRRLSAQNAKALLARACNPNKDQRLAVILDGSVRNNSVDDNVKKVASILLQPDIAEAYESLSEDGMSFDASYTSEQWQKLAADVEIENDSNFVRDNIYCVSHKEGFFKNTSYPKDNVSVNRGRLGALVNADFENRFTDEATDAGFVDVYRAIQKENYERAHSGSGQASMDEYVMPATAVAYILNYQEYDPIIYKDKIRVLELEPCRDYTYFYDGQSGTTEAQLRLQFAEDWAPDFVEKLAQDPDAITVEGMTTSEFCGKILDIYEEYDVIYIGANDGVLKRKTEAGGLKWVKADAYDGTISIKKDSNRYSYHDGKWYVSRTDGSRELVTLSGGPAVETGSVNQWDGSEGKNVGWKWVGGSGWQKDVGWTGNWVPSQQPCPVNLDYQEYHYEASTNTWTENRYIWSEEEELPNGIDFEWYNGNGDADSTWKWMLEGGQWIDNVHIEYERGWYQKKNVEETTYTSYHDPAMNGMVYVHTGDLLRDGNLAVSSEYDGHLANGGDQTYGYRSSGNDILKNQVDELTDYLKGGSLVILSSDFMTQDDSGRDVLNSSDVEYAVGIQTYRGILDTSSYLYRFVKSVCAKDAWGNDVPSYANLIIEGCGEGDVRDTEAFAEALNQQKVTLNLYSAPTAYSYAPDGEIGTIGERATLQRESDGKYYLNYEFIIGNLSAIAPLTTRYDVKLFLDNNSDGIYNTATEELTDITVINAQTGATLDRAGGAYQLQAGVPYRVRRELPPGYVGCIGWKLTVTQIGNGHIHDSVTGLTAVPVQVGYNDQVDPVTGKKIIHVLQIVPNEYEVVNLEKETERAEKEEGDWNQLLVCLPDFTIDFDSILYTDFAASFKRPGESGYDAAHDNGGTEGNLTGSNPGYNSKYGTNASGLRNDYLNLFQYDMVIVGFTDCYPSIPSQAATDALLRYADTGKSMLFTHDTTYSGFRNATPSNFNYSGTLGQPLSMSIRDICGMDRYGVSLDWYGYDGDGKAYDNIAANPLRTPTAASMQYNAASPVYQWYQTHNGGSRDVAYTAGSSQTMTAAQTQGLTYTMANQAYNDMFDWQSHGMSKPTGNGMGLRQDTRNADNTVTVTQVNSGIITQYPYDIPESIRVGDTHAQYYQLDLDTDWDGDGRGDVVCWYTIGSLNHGDWNDIYDFSPNDVRNNYYIYNKGNITYSGVGHFLGEGDVTTLDEKKLFVNTFVAAYNAGVRNPSVRIVDGASVNAPDLESVSVPFSGIDEATAGTYRVYYQVKDNNITQGTRNLSVRYYLADASGGDATVSYGSSHIPADLFADGELVTYSADTNLPVDYNGVRSGFTYYVDIPLTSLLHYESFNFFVEVDLTVAGSDDVAAFDVDRLTVAKLKMFNLD